MTSKKIKTYFLIVLLSIFSVNVKAAEDQEIIDKLKIELTTLTNDTAIVFI